MGKIQLFKTVIVGVFAWLFTQAVNAQANFLYIQTENNTPYSLNLKGNNYNSNAKGYLMIPQMQNGDYSIMISISGDQKQEYTYSFTIADKPKGYSLKLSQEGEWILMDMVTLETIRGLSSDNMGSGSAEKQVQKLSEKYTDKGIEIVYSVKNGVKTDKVDVIIPKPITSSIRKKTTKQQ
jgi:hypothetical protein